MKRRAFIGSSLSAMSLAILEHQIARAQSITPISYKNAPERFAEKFGFELYKDCWSDSPFVELYEEISQSLLKCKYRLPDKQAFLFAPFHLIMIPLELRVASIGCIDRSFLFFEQLPDAQWKYVKSLNAYEADAIIRVTETISDQLPEFLLPCYAKEHMPVSYFTRKGHVDMKILLSDAGVAATIQVWDRQQSLGQHTYHLSHGLKLAV